MSRPPRPPTATYRLQFSRRFTFRDAARLVPYLSALGISHIYASPYLKARSGSPHGYDITDYDALNPEVGDEADLAALATTLRAHGMGQILDFVPNHMGIGQADNRWWLDVLEWGRASPYADYFDIDWTPAKRDLRGKVLLPFLGDHYGRVLEGGELALAFDAEAGGFGVWYHEHLFPICPADYARILAPEAAQARAEAGGTPAVEAVEAVVARARALGRAGQSARRRAAMRERGERLKADLAALARAPEVRALVDAALARLAGEPGRARSYVPLHRLLEQQAYRLAYWRVAADEINYRRFFDINDLAGLKMERLDLFERAHARLWRWIADGVLDGVRIDHIDGLFDPAQYCRRLAARMAEAAAPSDAGEAGPAARAAPPPAYLVVEKILARHESLRQGWPVHGTTGYEALNLINGLFVRPEAEATLTRAYQRFTGAPADFDDVLYRAKKHIMQHALASELQVLANELDRISESNWRTRDFTLARLRAVLEEAAACFPVYRTYVDEAGASAEDRQNIDWAISQARKRSPDPEGTIFDFVHAVLTTDLVRQRRPGYNRRQVLRFARKFQQFTAPVTAKALEDTSFYRFNRLISLNEVGGDPRRFGETVSAFHHLNQERARHWPHAMIATGTHDAKRGEDARARIDVLSEVPGEWERSIRRWRTLNRWAKEAHEDERWPAANDEYFLYQTLLGSWPEGLLGEARPAPEALAAYAERVAACMIKAVREAKARSSWAHPNEAYEAALSGFVARILDPTRSARFLPEFAAFARRAAWFGMLNSLSQTLLKLTVPGVPDLYQGAELWALSMVDPDNRRPVDFARRAGALAEMADAGDGPAALRGMADAWPDGRIKLRLIHRILRLRQRRPGLFLDGAYVPLEVTGAREQHVCAFARVHEGDALVVVAPRFFVSLGEAGALPLGACWRDTSVACPPGFEWTRWAEALSGAAHAPRPGPAGRPIRLAEILTDLPVAALMAEGAGAPAGPCG